MSAITLQEFVHKIGFAVSLDGLNAYEKSLQRVDEKMEQMYGGAEKLIGRLESMGKQLSMKLTLPITALAGVSVAARVNQEQMQTEWGVLLGGMDKGIEFTKQMRELSKHTQFDFEQVDQYGKALKRLQTPTKEIIPMIKRFSDIAAGTGQDAGEMMQEYAQARLNPIMRGRVLQRLMHEGVVSEDDLRKAGLNPLLMRREGGLDRLGMQPLARIFNQLALKNMGKAAELAGTLGKNMKNFWEGLTQVREATGGVIEKTTHLKDLLKSGTGIFERLANWITHMPPDLQKITVGLGVLLAVLGPGMLIISGIAKGIMALRMALTVLALNPLTLELGALLVVAGALFLLLYKIKRMHDKAKESGEYWSMPRDKREAMDAANQEEMSKKAAMARGITYSPSKSQMSIVMPKYTGYNVIPVQPLALQGGGAPVVLNMTNTVTLPPGTTEQHATIVKDSLDNSARHTSAHIVKQLHNAMRGT